MSAALNRRTLCASVGPVRRLPASTLALFLLLCWPFELWPAPPSLSNLPLEFEPLPSQENAEAAFLVRAPACRLLVQAGGRIVWAPTGSENNAPEWMAMELLGARAVGAVGLEPIGSVTHHYGPEWRREDMPHYRRLRYAGVYPGIDLFWEGRQGELEYEFRLRPGSDPAQIRFRISGAGQASLDEDGNLILMTGRGHLSFRRPFAYQEVEGRRRPVGAGYRLDGDTLSFELEAYEPGLPLVIDPVVRFSTYLGGAGFDAAHAVATDGSGYIYLTGETASFDFPLPAGQARSARLNRDVFVTKLSPDGARVIYTTILASSGNDAGYGIAVDAAGNAYVTGQAGGSGFPVTSGALQTAYGRSVDAFVARLDSAGRLVYCTYLGGSGTDVGRAIAVDSQGSAYVTGYTGSVSFPTTAGAPQPSYGGGFYDAFLVKLNAAGSALLYGTLVGGAALDTAWAVAVNASGGACMAGFTESPNLAVRNALQPAYRGGGDAMVGCLNASGTEWNYLTYLGGLGREAANALAVNAAGEAFVAGHTFSSDFPVTSGAFQRTRRGDYDAFVAKLGASGALVWATLLGGQAADSATAIAVSSSGEVWVAGFTASFDFPVQESWQIGNRGSLDAFVSALSADGSSLVVSSYLGGGGEDRASGLALFSGATIVVGMTGSTDFPTTSGALQPSAPTPYNGFVARIGVQEWPPTLQAISPASGSGATQVFSVQASDPNGFQDIIRIQLLWNSAMTAANGCLVNYLPQYNALLLLNDAATQWLGPVAAGSSGILENSQCRINAASVTAGGSGNLLTLNVPVTFKPGFAGAKGIYAELLDGTYLAFPWQTVGSWTVPGEGPTLLSLAPSAGSGAAQTFVVQVSDPNGFQDIIRIQLLWNSAMTAANGCLVNYLPQYNALLLLNDAATQWLGPVAAGSSGILENSQCRINAASVTAGGSGNLLTLNVPVTFKPGFAGAKGIYAELLDGTYLAFPWQTVGSWTVPGEGPTLLSLAPSAGSGAAQTFVVQVSDPNGFQDIIRIQLLWNSAMTAANGCLVNYLPQYNALLLLNDAATQWLGPMAAGSSGILENSQCRINAASVTASGSGNVLTLNLPVSFKPSFAGAKGIYAELLDATYLAFPWQTVGSWTVPASP